MYGSFQLPSNVIAPQDWVPLKKKKGEDVSIQPPALPPPEQVPPALEAPSGIMPPHSQLLEVNDVDLRKELEDSLEAVMESPKNPPTSMDDPIPLDPEKVAESLSTPKDLVFEKNIG